MEENEKTGEQPDRPDGLPEQGQMELGSEETVGEMLLAAREKKGLALEAVSQETKIPVATLQYLETDNFEAIPAKVYATGFLKTYAQVLGLDPNQLINKYEIQTGQTHKSRGDLWEIEEELVEEKLGSTHLLRRFVIPAVLVIVAIIILWMVFGGGDEGTESQSTLSETGQQAETESRGETGDSAERTDDPGIVAADNRYDQEVPSGSDGAVEETVREEPAAVRQEPETAADPLAAGEMILRIIAEERIWFDVIVYTRTASGIDTTVADFILEPGQSRTFTSNEYFYIRKIGKTEGFTIELDGKPYEVPIVEGRLPRDITIPRNR